MSKNNATAAAEAEIEAVDMSPEVSEEFTPPVEEAPVALPTKARVLSSFSVDGVQYHPNDLIEAEAELIAGLGGNVDTHKDAVAYCEGNK
jgi:hypothetical protein